MSSPRRLGIKPVVLYELRMLRPIADLSKLLEFQASVSAWRGVEQWHVQAHRSARGEVVVRIACERHVSPTQTVRLDNQWASWRRTIVGALRLEGVAIRRGAWIEVDGHSYRGDVQVMHETFEKAVEKLWQEVGHEEAVKVLKSRARAALDAAVASEAVGATIAARAAVAAERVCD